MPEAQGRYLPVSRSRRWIADLMEASATVPLIPFERRMDLSPLIACRRTLDPRPSWCAIFLRGYALLAARHPVLRRAYLTWPWPRLYEHPTNVAAVAVEREWLGEPAVFFLIMRAPEHRPVCGIDDLLRRFQTEPVDQFGCNRRLLRLSLLPGPLRRLALWQVLNMSGPVRADHFGTFGVSVTAGQGAAALSLRSPLTTSLWYGPFDSSGALDVRLTFDHRVLDGAPVARLMVELEAVLVREVLPELRDGGRMAA